LIVGKVLVLVEAVEEYLPCKAGTGRVVQTNDPALVQEAFGWEWLTTRVGGNGREVVVVSTRSTGTGGLARGRWI
jgi:hypothetical protein